MVFNEIYGSYFRAVGAILTEAVKGPVTGSRIREIVQEKAFGESILTIPEALRAGRCWMQAEGLFCDLLRRCL